ncbi:MAG: NifU family protein [Phycisphaerales bacterium]
MPTKGRGQMGAGVAGGATVSDAASDDADLRGRVEKVLEAIRPAVKSDGGDLELVEITADRRVLIRMLGACIGCPSSMITLKMGVERNVKLYVPEIAGVEAVQ